MKRIVMKFGGTSVGDAESLRRTAVIVHQAQQTHEQVVVVISAMAGVTDQLIRCAQFAENKKNTSCSHQIAALQTQVADVLSELFLGKTFETVRKQIAKRFSELTRLCGRIQVAGQLTKKNYAAVVALGERINVIILSALLRQYQISSQPVEASQLIITDSRFCNASPIVEVTHRYIRESLTPLLEKDIVPVVTGFIGSNNKGEITTLGRGGSDYSAAILASALNAGELWIWKDVDGILTTDPKLLPEAQLVQQISFNETYELAYYGAKVLHPKTLIAARDGGIPIRIKNSFNPQNKGTLITPYTRNGEVPAFKAVTGIENIYLVSVEGIQDIQTRKISAAVSSNFSQQGKEVLAVFETTRDRSLHFAVREQPTNSEIETLKTAIGVLTSGIPHVWVWSGRGIVSIIGQANEGETNAVGETLSQAGVDMSNFCCQHSSNSMQYLVPIHQVKKAIQSIHSEVILNAQCR